MALPIFGAGVLIGTPNVANATPVNAGLVQGVSVDFSFTNKSLTGQFQLPIDVSRGTGKVSGKASMAVISGLAWAGLFFGVTPIAGQLATAFGEGGVIPAAMPYQITVANGATFVRDLGVINVATGLPLTKVASAPATGQYSVATGGVYTFAAADEGKAVLLNYNYTVASGGQQFTVTNQLLGFTPTFSLNLYTLTKGKSLNVFLPNCVASKLSIATKMEDYMIPELEFDIFADASGNIGTWSFSEVS